MAFVKIHGEILDSSVWSLPHAVRIVWVTMLAMADEHGVVAASVDGLARRAVVTLDECKAALASFLGPDPHSRDETTGERIEKVPGGWLILNHAEYRDRQTRAQILTADRVRRHREKRALQAVTDGGVTPHLPTSPSEAEADTEADDTFTLFWAAYPKKKAKQDAIKAWSRLTPEARALAHANVVARATADAEWLKDGGKFIPYPATYLNGRRWEDEAPAAEPERMEPCPCCQKPFTAGAELTLHSRACFEKRRAAAQEAPHA